MITTDAAPTAAELDAAFEVIGDEDLIHLVRPCDPDTALCGEAVPGHGFTDEEDEDGPWCPECIAIDRTDDTTHKAGCATCRDENGE